MWATSNTSLVEKDNRRGFTIVELLIVIVVIGILAAIVIVAYQGVQGRARAATAQAAAKHLTKLLTNYNTLNGAYPADLTTVNNGGPILTTDGTSYAYRPGSGYTSFCATVTNGNASYMVSDTAPGPTAGGCPGDGVGGVPPVSNYVLNPSFEDGTTNNGGNISASGGSRAIITGGAPYGNKFLRATFVDVTTLGWGQHSASVPTGTYTASFYVRSDIGIKFLPYLQGTATKTTVSSSGMVTVPPNSWVRAWTTVNVTAAGTIQVGGYFVKDTTTPTTSDYIDFDGFMLVAGSSTLNYADGNSPSWIWTGTANSSPSQGPQ